MTRHLCTVCWRPIELWEGRWSHVLPLQSRDPQAAGAILGMFALATSGHDATPNAAVLRILNS